MSTENKWEQAIKDACTVAGELGWDENDPRGSIENLIQWHVDVALDPRISEIAALLPGVWYMDPPDGGDVPITEQVRRMAEDATKWRDHIKTQENIKEQMTIFLDNQREDSKRMVETLSTPPSEEAKQFYRSMHLKVEPTIKENMVTGYTVVPTHYSPGERVQSAPHGQFECSGPTQPVKDREIRELVDSLCNVACKYHGMQQLRSRIADLVLPFVKGDKS